MYLIIALAFDVCETDFSDNDADGFENQHAIDFRLVLLKWSAHSGHNAGRHALTPLDIASKKMFNRLWLLDPAQWQQTFPCLRRYSKKK